MSLRFRLSGLVCAALLLSLALGSAISYANAKRSVRTEMRAAFVVGRQTIENAIIRLRARADPWPDLDALVASFDGNRHLRVRLGGQAPALAAPAAEHSPLGRAPAWFVRAIGVSPSAEQIPVVINGRDYGPVVIETDPYNETSEVWREFADSLVAPTVFCGLTILLIYIFIGRMLRPLDHLADALEEVGDGRYTMRLGGRLPPELARLRDSFNRMAARLATTDADNRRLSGQLAILREQERSDLARDLHDGISPFLFAINVDAAAGARLLAADRNAAAGDHLQSICEAVRHIQQQVRQMLRRLRPTGPAEPGLREAVEGMAAFWRRRCPEITYDVAIAPDCEDVADPAATTICRIVQEALSNAVRHAGPRRVTVAIDRDQNGGNDYGHIRLQIADDGRGMEPAGRKGHGLLGITERVAASGGKLTFSNRPGEGFAMTAVLPCEGDGAVLAGCAVEAAEP